MSLRILPLSAFALLTTLAACAGPAPEEGTSADALDAPAASAPMRSLDFLSGEWRGEGSIQTGPGTPHHFAETERVEAKLGGVLLTLEGAGTSLAADEQGRVVHAAYGVLFHEPRGYRMRAFTADGRTIECDVQVGERTLTWGFQAGPQATRYTIRVTRDLTWTETGETSADGQTWRPFFEMKLERVSR